jgi:hypothetical protein
MTTRELVAYYSNLLIKQYNAKPKAAGICSAIAAMSVQATTTVDAINFSEIPATGTFTLSYDDETTAAINWSDSIATVQSKISALSGLSDITASGAILSQSVSISFDGVIAPALPLCVASNSLLDANNNPITISIQETDLTLPLAVLNGYNLQTAVGVQLDVLGKYAGVTRNVNSFLGGVTLDDDDFRTLIQVFIIMNASNYSLASIQSLIQIFFSGSLFVFDFKNMHMGYAINPSGPISSNLATILALNGWLPKPMGVTLANTIYSPNVGSFFGFRTYAQSNPRATPFNGYADYHTDWYWLRYSDSIDFVTDNALLTPDGEPLLTPDGQILTVP